jgi:hypothetical protein
MGGALAAAAVSALASTGEARANMPASPAGPFLPGLLLTAIGAIVAAAGSRKLFARA